MAFANVEVWLPITLLFANLSRLCAADSEHMCGSKPLGFVLGPLGRLVLLFEAMSESDAEVASGSPVPNDASNCLGDLQSTIDIAKMLPPPVSPKSPSRRRTGNSAHDISTRRCDLSAGLCFRVCVQNVVALFVSTCTLQAARCCRGALEDLPQNKTDDVELGQW